jgi:two-component system, chemotaxis family, response regulator Rcp1
MRTETIEILLIEDNPADVYLIREAFKLGDIPKRLSVAADGEEALAILFTNGGRPDLIILDLNLPKIDGRQVLEAIKSHRELKQIPVLVLSTSDSERDVISAYEHHANCYLTKPTDLDQFLDIVQAVEEYWLNYVALPAG